MKVGVLGAGSFGTALGHLLATKDFDVVVYAREKAVADSITNDNHNPKYLKDCTLAENLQGTHELEKAVAGKDLLISAVPSQVVRKVFEEAKQYLGNDTIVVSASKGIENKTLLPMSGVFEEVLDWNQWKNVAYLSGPSFAKEIVELLPTAVTMAAQDEEIAQKVQEAFATPYFRTYYTTDVMGVELGGALKNVIAIAAGIVDGLEIGHNARAAVITRGLAEITRLGVKMGAQSQTFAGLAGMGDLVLTCTGGLSRNRRVGIALGHGQSIEEIAGGMDEVAEGVKTAVSVHDLARRENVECPLSDTVYQVLYEDLNPKAAVQQLMTRELKAEQA